MSSAEGAATANVPADEALFTGTGCALGAMPKSLSTALAYSAGVIFVIDSSKEDVELNPPPCSVPAGAPAPHPKSTTTNAAGQVARVFIRVSRRRTVAQNIGIGNH